ncbi:PqqD family peptide modification chaperone [Spirosoma sp. HMF3257]|uniref:PqqD family protein n=1 Tax=Spirosoma telluris TaxID=2183553 RepID=A0A327NKG0_9BACT|nr:PqqD family peptide modification chaperone [Spirosoma telluris]RAI75283.1 hypothetical protein HMF3257_15825 [Spirosoma telluris]
MIVNQYIISPAIVCENFDNEVIIVNMSRGHYYSLRDASFTIWQGLAAGLSPENLLAYLTTTYTVEENALHQPLRYFLDQLAMEGLIIEGTPAQVDTLPAPENRQAFTSPTLEIYTDMADLLALDPIHDVSPVEGWPIKK